jgi:hypothetical protein
LINYCPSILISNKQYHESKIIICRINSSCTVDHYINRNFDYTNQSDHTVQILGWSYNQELITSLLISLGETISRQTEGRPSGVFDPNLGDSIIVVYDESISVPPGHINLTPIV